MSGGLVRILSSCLILEERQKELFADQRVRVQEGGPSREDDIRSARVLRNRWFSLWAKKIDLELTPSLDISVFMHLSSD